MGATTGSIRVSIFGDEYSVRSDVDQATTKKVAEFVHKKMMETRDNVSSGDKVKIAVLSAMNIAGELLSTLDRSEQRESELSSFESRTKELARKIDAALRSLG